MTEIEKAVAAAFKAHYAERGRRGGASRSPKKLAAIKQNLERARQKRWPHRVPVTAEMSPTS
jgi:hypothetical protein